ncbi:gliding motility-associated C-terminal domain-containing protein [Niastella caeni]|uniref:Gliding motility-associated C-terminal domain-containing protein n=1 Tax=Niastella caeni TaxID=2569763 RepID=A0A4S8HRX2_9BACT|nr:gliding motility-associated C-terminal domain-containing protein [Niastella caeni]THU38200.1 gliding motility-associated C-terminal domain-containing protein [Niastella caeni]
MNRKPIPLIIFFIITLWCNNAWAQSTPVLLISNNPSSCNGSEGSFSFSGLLPNTTYQVTYTDDGVVTGPVTIASTATGQLTITGLNAGIYSNFIFNFNGSISNVLTGQQLSNPINVPEFTPFAPFCQGSTPPVLPPTSNAPNSISGTWNPAVVNNQTSGTYTFTPAAGTCGTPVPINITVIPKETATFPFGTSLTICHNGTVPVLPNTSDNGISGTWSPAVVDPTQSGTYIFTATSPGCVEGTTLTVTVNPNVPSIFPFGTSTTICEGDPVVTLPASSSNGITGTWNPAVVSNTTSGTYTFTPDNGQCATTATYTVTVNPNVIPTFDPVAPICSGATLSSLPTTSNNGITGSWSPALNNTATTTYTFTPTAGLCARTATLTITVDAKVTPTFTTADTICAGATLTALPTTSDNGITGTWSPALNNTATTTYTFTPTAGQCANATTLTITVNPNITPAFAPVAPICSGDALTALPTTSTNGITGTWAPALDNTATTTYTFTPDAGQCATITTLTITVNPIVTPTFNAVAPICSGSGLPPLPTTSTNGISGTWAPALNDTVTTTYTFTPTAGQCAITTTLTVTVIPNVKPTFTPVAPICFGNTIPALPTTSDNGITGTWSPALNHAATTTYTFTPTAGVCATTDTLTIVVNVITPTFPAADTICSGAPLAALPTTSDNGITGTWAPALNNTATTTYTFTPAPGQCATTTTLTIIVNQKVTPTFAVAASVCSGATLAPLPLSSANAIPVTGTWSPALSNTTTTTYTFTPDSGQCAIPTTFTLQVNPIPSLMNITRDTAIYDGTVLAPYNFRVNDPAGGIQWNNSNPAIGLSASGTGMVPSFTATNISDTPFTAIITTIPVMNGCSGVSQSFKITVLPLAKDVFVPNIFSPNGDGKNEQLFIYGNYIASVDMQIFNQWGQRLATLTSTQQGWDGKYKGTAQPVGVYMYVLKAVLRDGRQIKTKGSITLIR